MNSNWSYSPETLNLGQNCRFFSQCDQEIWRMTLKNNWVPLLCHFKLCVLFRSHLWIQTGVTVWKRSIWGKICLDLCDLDHWPLTLTYCMDNGNHSWEFHDDMMKRTLWTRHSENDNIAQPLDQWMDSPFIGQQVGNCNSFTSTHHLANVFDINCHALWAKSKTIVHPTLYPNHISFIPSQSTFPFLKYGYQPIKNLTLKIQGHGWGQSFKVTTWANILSTHILFVPC